MKPEKIKRHCQSCVMTTYQTKKKVDEYIEITCGKCGILTGKQKEKK